VCDLETSRIGAPYIYNVRLLRVNVTTEISEAKYSKRCNSCADSERQV